VIFAVTPTGFRAAVAVLYLRRLTVQWRSGQGMRAVKAEARNGAHLNQVAGKISHWSTLTRSVGPSAMSSMITSSKTGSPEKTSR
jgi:hypothetical protein